MRKESRFRSSFLNANVIALVHREKSPLPNRSVAISRTPQQALLDNESSLACESQKSHLIRDIDFLADVGIPF